MGRVSGISKFHILASVFQCIWCGGISASQFLSMLLLVSATIAFPQNITALSPMSALDRTRSHFAITATSPHFRSGFNHTEALSSSFVYHENHGAKTEIKASTSSKRYCFKDNNPGVDGNKTTTCHGDECLLWDESCPGNRTLAVDKFFEELSQGVFEGEQCFGVDNCTLMLNYTAVDSPQTLSEKAKVKSWMRSPQCVSSAVEWVSRKAESLPFQVLTTSGGYCCGRCEIDIPFVDIFYWPQPDADTSCLSIVKDEVFPIDYAAKFDDFGAYWGCSLETSETTSWSTYWMSSGSVSVESFIITARLETWGAVTFRSPVANPWSVPGCVQITSSPQPSPRLFPFGHMPLSSSVRQNHLATTRLFNDNGSMLTTVVTEGMTL